MLCIYEDQFAARFETTCNSKSFSSADWSSACLRNGIKCMLLPCRLGSAEALEEPLQVCIILINVNCEPHLSFL